MSFAVPIPAPADLLKPNGALQFDEGGNARGADSVDFQRVRTDDAQVAAASGSFSAGERNTVYGPGSIVMGLDNVVGIAPIPFFADRTIALGYSNVCTQGTDSVLIGSNNTITDALSVGIAIGSGNTLSTPSPGPKICIGVNNKCVSSGIVAIGERCEARQLNGIAIGQLAKTHTQSEFCISHFGFDNVAGSSQFSMWHAARETDNATANQVLLYAPGGPQAQLLLGNRTYVGSVDLLAHEIGGSLAAAAWHWEVAFEKRNNDVTLHNSTLTYTYNPESLGAALDDSQNDTLRVNVTGKASRTFRWMAVYRFIHVSD